MGFLSGFGAHKGRPSRAGTTSRATDSMNFRIAHAPLAPRWRARSRQVWPPRLPAWASISPLICTPRSAASPRAARARPVSSLRRTAASRGRACARTPLTSRIRTGRSRTDGRTRRRDGERGDGGRGGGRARGPCSGPRYRRAGGGAGTRSGERGATGSARSCAIPPQGHVRPVVYSRRRAPASVDADSTTARAGQAHVRHLRSYVQASCESAVAFPWGRLELRP